MIPEFTITDGYYSNFSSLRAALAQAFITFSQANAGLYHYYLVLSPRCEELIYTATASELGTDIVTQLMLHGRKAFSPTHGMQVTLFGAQIAFDQVGDTQFLTPEQYKALCNKRAFEREVANTTLVTEPAS